MKTIFRVKFNDGAAESFSLNNCIQLEDGDQVGDEVAYTFTTDILSGSDSMLVFEKFPRLVEAGIRELLISNRGESVALSNVSIHYTRYSQWDAYVEIAGTVTDKKAYSRKAYSSAKAS